MKDKPLPKDAIIKRLKKRKGKYSQVVLEHLPLTLPPPAYEEVEIPLTLHHVVIRAVSYGGFTVGRPASLRDDAPESSSFAFSSKADLMAFLAEVLPDGK